MKDSSRKILVINLTRLGDILQSTPLLRVLKRKHPGAEIHYLAVGRFAEVCNYIPEIDHVIPFEFGSAIAASKDAIRALPRRIREVDEFIDSLRRMQFDTVINLSQSRISALLCHLLNVNDTRGLTLDREGFRQIRQPWARYFFTANLNRSFNRFNLVDIQIGLACEPEDDYDAAIQMWHFRDQPSLSFQVSAEALDTARSLTQNWTGRSSGPLIGIQPGASLPNKRWPAAKFAGLGKLLHEALSARILVLGSKAEEALAAEAARPLGDQALNLAGKTNVVTLAALLQRLDLLITNDTGTQHLAAAVGTRVLSLCLGSALSHETGPYGPGHVVVEPRMRCFPCSFHVECPRFRCHEQVQPEAIFSLAHGMLLSKGKSPIAENDAVPFENLKVWHTDFDHDGFWIQRPIFRRPLTSQDYINLISRDIWKEVLLNRNGGDPAERPSGRRELDLQDYIRPAGAHFEAEMRDGCAAFRQLEALARSGESLCPELEDAGRSARASLDGILCIADQLAEIDRQISLVGTQRPDVHSLVLDFIWGKQNLEGHQVHRLAAQTRELYHRLAQLAGRVSAALSHGLDHEQQQCNRQVA